MGCWQNIFHDLLSACNDWGKRNKNSQYRICFLNQRWPTQPKIYETKAKQAQCINKLTEGLI
jgi:hypothetical protein